MDIGGRRSPPSHLPPAPHSPLLAPGNSVSHAGGTAYPGMHPHQQRMVYASPSASMPNGGVILSVRGGGPPYFTIPLPLGVPCTRPPTDLSKTSK